MIQNRKNTSSAVRQRTLTGFVFALGLAIAPQLFTQGLTDWAMKGLAAGTHPFKLKSLPYPLEAISPYLDPQTIQMHLSYQAKCVTQLNKDVGQDLEFYRAWEMTVHTNLTTATDRWLEEMLKSPISIPEKIRLTVKTNASGHYNHSLFWQMMKPKGGGEPTGTLGTTIEQEFGSFAQFKEKFTRAAVEQANDGWTWLSLDAGKLKIEFLTGEESPLSSGRPVLLGIDLWKHAYEAQYGTNREKYITAWFKVVNWDFVAQRYEELKPNP